VVRYCNFDWSHWAGKVDGYKSTTGYCFLLSQGDLSWNSKKQPTMALLNTMKEYMAFTNAANKATWLQQLCKDIAFH